MSKIGKTDRGSFKVTIPMPIIKEKKWNEKTFVNFEINKNGDVIIRRMK